MGVGINSLLSSIQTKTELVWMWKKETRLSLCTGYSKLLHRTITNVFWLLEQQPMSIHFVIKTIFPEFLFSTSVERPNPKRLILKKRETVVGTQKDEL